tara:strand:+ start:105 stop:230 length:126 start_codon:yes stop_codon:yes gene_type:complete
MLPVQDIGMKKDEKEEMRKERKKGREVKGREDACVTKRTYP